MKYKVEIRGDETNELFADLGIFDSYDQACAAIDRFFETEDPECLEGQIHEIDTIDHFDEMQEQILWPELDME